MDSCIDMIEEQSGEQKEMLRYLYGLFSQAEGVRPRLIYGIPFFCGKKRICYLNPLKNGQVEVVFNRGRELSNTIGLLDARGRKQVMGVIFSALTHIQEDDLMATWWEAVLLDRATPVKHNG